MEDKCGYRSGYGKPWRVTLSSGPIEVRRPRDRIAEERFERRVLPLCAQRSSNIDELIPELYLHGLAEGNFDLALRGLFREEGCLSLRVKRAGTNCEVGRIGPTRRGSAARS